jgi:hypothetical protein
MTQTCNRKLFTEDRRLVVVVNREQSWVDRSLQAVFAAALASLAASAWFSLWLCMKFMEAIGGP